MKVYVVEWEEYEEGWGPRPDGYSIHTSEESMEAYIDKYGRKTGIHSAMPLGKYIAEVDGLTFQKIKNKSGMKHEGHPADIGIEKIAGYGKSILSESNKTIKQKKKAKTKK